MRNKYYAKTIAIAGALVGALTLTVFAASESGSLGSRGSYSFSCTSGNFLSKYVTGSSSASYNGNTDGGSDYRYVFTEGLARVDVTLSDGTNNTKSQPFSGTTTSDTANLTVYGQNEGSAYCYARVSGIFLYSDGTTSPINNIEASTLSTN